MSTCRHGWTSEVRLCWRRWWVDGSQWSTTERWQNEIHVVQFTTADWSATQWAFCGLWKLSNSIQCRARPRRVGWQWSDDVHSHHQDRRRVFRHSTPVTQCTSVVVAWCFHSSSSGARAVMAGLGLPQWSTGGTTCQPTESTAVCPACFRRPTTWSRQATATTTSLVVRSWTRGVQTVRLDVSLSPRSWSGLPRVTLWAYLICVQDKNYAQRLMQLWWFQLHDIPHLAIGLFLLLLLSFETHCRATSHLLHHFWRAKAECFARLCHRLGVRPSVRPSVRLSVRLSHSWSVSKRCKPGSRNLHYGLPKVFSLSWQNFVPLGAGVPLECGRQRGVPSKKDVILPLLARIMWTRLQIGTYMLLIITSTGDRLFGFINIDDLEWPWNPQKEVLVNFSQFLDAAHISTLNCDEMDGDRPRQPA